MKATHDVGTQSSLRPLSLVFLCALCGLCVHRQSVSAQALPPAYPRIGAPAATASAQAVDPLAAFQESLDALKQQNADLRNELRALREEFEKMKQAGAASPAAERLDSIEEKVDLQATRVAEHDLVKVESSQRVPIRLTGMLLFNAFGNSKYANPGRDDPYYAASAAATTRNVGGSFRQSLFGLDFHTPQAVLGGEFNGSAVFDIFGLSDSGGDRVVAVSSSTSPRLRTAWIEGRWGNRSVLAGLANTIVSPREPTSFAQVYLPPLSGAGNLYGWRQQIRFEQRVGLGDRQDLTGQVAIAQTSEDWPRVPAGYLSTLETKRPALEAHVAFSRAFDDKRRLEIGAGLHRSETHIAGLSIPSRIYGFDWFVSPISRVEFSGMFWTGENVGNLAGRNSYGVSILTPSPGVVQGVGIRELGGWAQVALHATKRLRVNFYSGIEDPNDGDTVGLDGVIRNLAGVTNTFFQVAPNVITGFELSQIRTWYKAGQTPRLNHYDVYIAYLF